ncbi:MAG: tRNA-dihydrouridine synthase family protein [Anaerovoracaceae bacterium]
MKKYEIGGIFFDTPYFMAPLAGITDSPFRRLCRKFGAGAVYSEMISAKGMYYNDKITEKLLTIREEEMPVVYQIFGSDPETMAYAADALSSRRNCMIDINMGCPVPKIVKGGDGSALLKDPEKVSKIVSATVRAAKSR